MQLSFGEQIKILLKRQNLTIKDLANLISEYTGKPMSRQNLTQKLTRDNFQEQDMRLIAKILGYDLNIALSPIVISTPIQPTSGNNLPVKNFPVEDLLDSSFSQMTFSFDDSQEIHIDTNPGKIQEAMGEINPQTGNEYENNTVRVHPSQKGYLQVYEQEQHQWVDISEHEFYRFQQRKRQLLGSNYKPPIYI